MATKQKTTPTYDTLGGLDLIGNRTGTQVNLPVNTGGGTTLKMPATNQSSIEAGKKALEQLLANQGKTSTGTGSTGTGSSTSKTTAVANGYYVPVKNPRAGEYAQQVAESYARSQPGNQPAWEDKWQPQIDALQGGRYGPYESPYQQRIDGLLDRIMDRGEFQYNWSDDPLYRQYAARYQQQARQGMQDAMGQAAALTGGYGSTYGQAAGQQAYANQMQGLNDAAMQLYQAAKDRYDTETARQFQQMGTLEQREAVNRGMYEDDRDTWYNRLDADIANLRNSQMMGFNVYQDAADREMAERQDAWNKYQYWNALYEQLQQPIYQWRSNAAAYTQDTAEDILAALAEEEKRKRLQQQQQQSIRESNTARKTTNRVNMDR